MNLRSNSENEGLNMNRNTNSRSSDSNEHSPMKSLQMRKKISFFDYKFIYHCFNESECNFFVTQFLYLKSKFRWMNISNWEPNNSSKSSS